MLQPQVQGSPQTKGSDVDIKVLDLCLYPPLGSKAQTNQIARSQHHVLDHTRPRQARK
jgi:hypothetical protein